MNSTEHLLVCLAEEASEIIKDASKSLRFGLEDRNVLEPTGPTNRERLIAELNDLMAVVDLLIIAEVIPLAWADGEARLNKRVKVRKFMAYAHDKGALLPK